MEERVIADAFEIFKALIVGNDQAYRVASPTWGASRMSDLAGVAFEAAKAFDAELDLQIAAESGE